MYRFGTGWGAGWTEGAVVDVVELAVGAEVDGVGCVGAVLVVGVAPAADPIATRVRQRPTADHTFAVNLTLLR
jgi:hypothetical protein